MTIARYFSKWPFGGKRPEAARTCVDSLFPITEVAFFSVNTTRPISSMTETPEQRAQNSRFGYKAPESVYKKHDPKSSMVGSGTFEYVSCHPTHILQVKPLLE